jgi:hypothetical protein
MISAAPPLNLATLEKCLRGAGERRRSFHGADPFIGYVETSDGREVGGRFFPSRNAILVYRTRDDEVTRATVNHELCHGLQYENRCGCTCGPNRSGCGYVGQHDAAFYRELEKLHRATRVSPAAAREPEGNYKYPAHWKRDDAW